VTQQYMHCGKALRRSGLWKAEEWAGRSVLPTLGSVLRDQMPALSALPVEQIEEMLESDYSTTLWQPGGAA
jgi:hypothetical protein